VSHKTAGRGSFGVILLISAVLLAGVWLGLLAQQARFQAHLGQPFTNVEEFLEGIDGLPRDQCYVAYERLRRQGHGEVPKLEDSKGVPLLSRLILDDRHEAFAAVVALAPVITLPKDARGWTPLHYAAASRFSWRFLPALGIFSPDVLEQRDNQGRTPLHIAAERDDMMAVGILMAMNHIVLEEDLRDLDGDTPLHLAIKASDPTSIGTIALLARETNQMVPDRQGRTPLLLAADLGKESAVRALSEAGDDPNRPDQDHRTARTVLKQRNPELYRDLVPIWRRNGFAVDHDESGRTPMMQAVDKSDWRQVELLSIAGADPNAIDNRGRTPRQEIERRNPALHKRLLPVWDDHCFNTAWEERSEQSKRLAAPRPAARPR
jgi:ankyrin repeat protein